MRRPPDCASPAPSCRWRPDVPGDRDLGAGLAAHEFGQAAGQFAFGRVGKGLIEHFGDGEAEHPVAQELEPLIACARPCSSGSAHMGQRLREQVAGP